MSLLLVLEVHGGIFHSSFKTVLGNLEPGSSPVSLPHLYLFIFFPANSFCVQIKCHKIFSKDWESYSKVFRNGIFFLSEKNIFTFLYSS